MDKVFISESAKVLNDELDWFYKLLDTRIKLHFGHDCDYQDIFAIEPPNLPDNDNLLYKQFIDHYQINFEERVILVLALVSQIRPQILDVLFTRNAALNKEFSEFGGHTNSGGKTFLPTGETALFLLAGDNLEKRFLYSYLFDAEHFFVRHKFITLTSNEPNAPYLSGILTISDEVLELITRGKVKKPVFSAEFPAKLIETQMTWEDLILDPYTLEQIYEIKLWIDHGDKILADPELAKNIQPGYRSLFYGPSGTGKTLCAALLGKVTERDVYRIDLSLVISKYIGETEKNLEKIFTQAEHKDWILFFDEADALFGKRTNVNEAHDRFANQDVSFLLQRMEDFDGVVILASNFKSNIDEAFTRRFQSIIHFPMPKQSERLRLWQGAFSSQYSLGEDINLEQISAEYELTGGAIINVVRYASLMAIVNHQTSNPQQQKNKVKAKSSSDQKHQIQMLHIHDGIRKEFQKEGRTL